ncbi:hypothetical protein AB5I41_15605 [Sphingomonas sp. MMS24-JH45]
MGWGWTVGRRIRHGRGVTLLLAAALFSLPTMGAASTVERVEFGEAMPSA